MKMQDNGNNKKVYIRPVNVAEFIYNLLDKKGLLNDEVKDMLGRIIIDLKNEKFEQLAQKWGADP